MIFTLSGHDTPYLFSITISRDGSRILTGALDGTIQLRDSSDGAQLPILEA
jgi:WD40 repeat protein